MDVVPMFSRSFFFFKAIKCRVGYVGRKINGKEFVWLT